MLVSGGQHGERKLAIKPDDGLGQRSPEMSPATRLETQSRTGRDSLTRVVIDERRVTEFKAAKSDGEPTHVRTFKVDRAARSLLKVYTSCLFGAETAARSFSLPSS